MKIIQVKNHLEIIDTRFYGEMYSKVMACPDARALKNGRFLCSNSFANIEHLIQTFPEALWDSNAEMLKFEYHAKKKQEQLLLEQKTKDFGSNNYPDVFKTKPFAHQLQAFEVSKDAESYGLFFEQGCGKTKVTIDNAVYLYLNGKIDSLVIIAPNGVHMNWIKTELPVHCNVEYDAFCWDGKLTKKRIAEFEAVRNSKKLKIFAFNIECFVSEKTQKMILGLLTRSMLVVDESQGIKNPSALRTKFITKAAKNSNIYKRILSGTPVTKGVEDLYSQFQFLDPKIIGLDSFYTFKAKYCILKRMSFSSVLDKSGKPRQFSKIVGYQKMDDLQQKIQTYTTRVLKSDCLDLPEKIYQREYFTLTPDQLRVDGEIMDDGIAWVRQCKNNNEPITFANALARLTKRQQVACGYLLNTDGEMVLEIVKPEKNPRLLRLRSVLDNIRGKTIIWCRFTQDVNYVMKMLGDEAVRYDGLVSSDDKERNKNDFQNLENIRYFVAKPIKGLTLTAATYAIYYSNDFDLEKRQQSEDRNHRYGTKEVLEKEGLSNITYIDLEAVGSIDGKIISALRAKKKLADMVLQDPENLFMENN